MSRPADQPVSQTEMTFRAMQTCDLEAVLGIENALCEIPWTRRNFQDCLDSDYQCCVMYQGNSHIGHFQCRGSA